MDQQELLQALKQEDEQVQQPMPMLPSSVPSEILEMELNYEKSLDALEKKLSGFTQVLEGKQRVWKETQKPWMNNRGVSRIIAIIKGHIDVNTFLSNLQESDINEISYDIADEMATILSNKCKEFEIDPTYLGILHSIIVNNIFFALKRAQNALTLRKIHDTTSRIEHPLQAEQARIKERKGFLGRFF